MLFAYDGPTNLAGHSWALSEDQRHLCDAVERFARKRLAPLFAQSATPENWDDTMRLAGELDIGTMILPAHLDGLEVEHSDLYLVVQHLTAGPLERAAELTLSVPALMTLREQDALDCLPERHIREYFDGSASISLAIPGNMPDTAWILQRHADAPLLLPSESGDDRSLRFVAPHQLRDVVRKRVHAAALGALGLEQITVDRVALESCLQITCGARGTGAEPVRTLLVETGFYLCALLVGTMQQSIAFALDYAATRYTFRKPLAAHQLIATRLADMLIAAQGSWLFLWALAVQGPSASDLLICQLMRHVASEAMEVSRDLVQLCGGHGYVEGLPPAAHFQTIPRFALLLAQTERGLEQCVSQSQPLPHRAHP